MTDTDGLFTLASFEAPPSGATVSSEQDFALDDVCDWFAGHTELENRFGAIFRQSIDEVLDGQRTGRFDIYNESSVSKTERTYLGTKVEIVCRAAFELDPGYHMDYLVASHEVDAKFSMSSRTGQAIPREAIGRICMLMHADDRSSRFSVGLVRPQIELLNKGANQDGKKTLNRAGREAIRWLIQNGRLPVNQLLKLSSTVRSEIFDPSLSKQQRVDQLFRLLPGTVLDRNTVITVAQQHDGPKRVRDSRKVLCREGFIILGYRDEHPRIAREFGLRVPRQGEWISMKIRPAHKGDTGPRALIGGVYYVAVVPGDRGNAPANY